MVELPSIGPFLPTASAPAALARRSGALERHAQRQAGDEGAAEAVPGPGRVDLLGREGRRRDPALAASK